METTMTPTRIRKNGKVKIVDKKNGYRDQVINVNAYETGVLPDRRGINPMINNVIMKSTEFYNFN